MRERTYLINMILGDSDSKESACNAGDTNPGFRRSSEEGNGKPLQDSCLKNSMDRGAWWGYSTWGRRESYTTELLTCMRAHTHAHTHTHTLQVLMKGRAKKRDTHKIK